MIKLLQRSINEKIPLEMMYLSSRNQITHRKVLIHEIKGSSFRAYCYVRKQPRLFSIENVLALSVPGTRERQFPAKCVYGMDIDVMASQ